MYPQTMSSIASTSVTVRLPESLRRRVESLAAREGFTVEQFIASATSEKLAVWMSLDPLREEAARGQPDDLHKFLAAVPDSDPAPSDQVSPNSD
jgi:hypothetical protein